MSRVSGVTSWVSSPGSDRSTVTAAGGLRGVVPPHCDDGFFVAPPVMEVE